MPTLRLIATSSFDPRTADTYVLKNLPDDYTMQPDVVAAAIRGAYLEEQTIEGFTVDIKFLSTKALVFEYKMEGYDFVKPTTVVGILSPMDVHYD